MIYINVMPFATFTFYNGNYQVPLESSRSRAAPARGALIPVNISQRVRAILAE